MHFIISYFNHYCRAKIVEKWREMDGGRGRAAVVGVVARVVVADGGSWSEAMVVSRQWW